MRPHAHRNKTGGVLIALLDIDAMKRGFEQVRVSRDEALAERDLSATLLDLSGALIVVRDPDGAITGFNAACQEASGYTFEDRAEQAALGSPAPAGGGGTRPSPCSRRSAMTRDHGQSSRIAGSARTEPARSSPGRAWPTTPGRSVTRVIGTGLDITRARPTEDALRQSQGTPPVDRELSTTQEEERKRLAGNCTTT